MEDRIQGNLEETEYEELGDDQKVSIGKWFLLNAPPGQVLQVAKGNVSIFRRAQITVKLLSRDHFTAIRCFCLTRMRSVGDRLEIRI